MLIALDSGGSRVCSDGARARGLTRMPCSALAHPAWWAALVVLVVNDHLLKGARVLPELLTGKISDYAGLFVASVLLSAVVGARSARARFVCVALVGGMFGATKLSADAAGVVVAATTLI